MRFLLLPHYPHIGPQAGLRSCGLYYIDIMICWPWEMGCASLAAAAGRWASGTESIGALQLKPAQPQLLASRCSAAAGGRLGAQSSVRPPPASGPQHASPPTSSHWEERRAWAVDGPASAASHRSNMAFLSTRTPTPPGRGPVNTGRRGWVDSGSAGVGRAWPKKNALHKCPEAGRAPPAAAARPRALPTARLVAMPSPNDRAARAACRKS